MKSGLIAPWTTVRNLAGVALMPSTIGTAGIPAGIEDGSRWSGERWILGHSRQAQDDLFRFLLREGRR